jgi:hypothetical protein
MLAGALAASLAANTQAGLIHRYSFNSSGSDSVGSAPATLLNGASIADIYDSGGSVLGAGVFLNNADASGSVIQFTNFLSSSSNYQYVALPSSTITNAKCLTIESWFFVGDGNSASTNWARIFDFGDNATTSGQGANFIQFSPWGSYSSQAAKLEFKIGSSDIVISNNTPLSGYHHAACVFDCSNSLVQLYIDGAFASQTSTTNQITNVGTNALWLGRSEWSGDYYFYGYINEFRIYDRALSAVEIMANFVVGTTNAAPVAATVLDGLDSVNITGPSSVVEQYQSNVVATASFGTGSYNLALINAPGFTLTSSDPTVATVDQVGNIKALKPGTTQIIASYGGKTGALNLTVTADTTPPVVTLANTKFYNNLIELTFSKILDTNSATTTANYVIDGGAVSVTQALLVTNDALAGVGVVRLYTAQFAVNAAHTVVINNVKDTDVSPNKIAANTTVNFGSVAGSPQAYILYFGKDGYSYSSITNGMTNAGFPNSGGRLYSLTTGLTDSGSKGDSYVGVVDGWLVPPEDGDYAFSIASDDESAFYLSADSSSNNLPKYANIYQSGYTSSKTFSLITNGAWHLQDGSTPTTNGWTGWTTNLVANQHYYFRYIHRNGSGSDQFDVAWAKNGSSVLPTAIANGITNIEAKYIIPEIPANVTLAITNQPTNTVGYQGRTVILSSGAYGVPSYVGVQWYKDGQAVAGATNAIYTNTSVKISDAGTYYAVFTNYVVSVQSASVTLAVTPDTTPPTVSLVWTIVGKSVIVNYSEQVEASSATTYANYVLTNKAGAVVAITNAVLDSTASNVTLYVATQLTTNFTLTISGVKDLATNTIVKVTKTGYYYGMAKDMVAYWPLDNNIGYTTPDLAYGYDFTLLGFTTNSLGVVPDFVPGIKGNCLNFNGSQLAWREDLTNSSTLLTPIVKSRNFTISMWVKGAPAQGDQRFFHMGYCAGLANANGPLFVFGTHDNTAGSNTVGVMSRPDDSGTFTAHYYTAGNVLDNTWHHFVWVQATDSVSTNVTTAAVYIDGVKDTASMPSTNAHLSATRISIGAIMRAGGQAYFKGYIDDVAIWNRALTVDEVTNIYNGGTPNTPSPVTIPQPLEIRYFKKEFSAVPAGNAIKLSWSGSKDATAITITPDVGDVTGATLAGLGSVMITPTATKTYTLTLTRGVESITQTLEVPVVSALANPGWVLLDNFDRNTNGTLPSTYWTSYLDGSFNVVDYNGNKMIQAPGTAIQAVELGTYTINEGQVATLFTRLIQTNTDSSGADSNAVVLTDITPRYPNESWGTLGPGIKYLNPAGALQAYVKNGYYLADGTTNTTDTNSGFTFEVGSVYNVWVDVTNDTVANEDLFSVYIAKDGDAERTLVFDQIRSERSTNDTSIFGPVKSSLQRLVIASWGSYLSTVLMDDMYLSPNAYNSTVPAPFGYTSVISGVKPTITAVVSGSNIILSWDAANGAGYTLLSSATVDGAFTADSATPTTTGSTTSVTIPLSGTAKFYRLKK